MKIIKMECPYCGGSLEVKPDQKIVTCSYCGKQIFLEDQNTASSSEKSKPLKKKTVWKNRILLAVRCLLVLFAFLGMAAGFDSDRWLAGMIGLIQMGLLICTFFPFFSEKKHMNVVLTTVAVILLVPFSITLTSSDFEPVKDLKWPSTSLAKRIPEPETDKGTVSLGDGKTLYAFLQKVSYDQYTAYVESCKDRGFTEYAKEDSYGYDAVDQDGYVLSLNYSTYDNEMDLKLESPKPWKSIKWPVSQFASLLPDPQSDTGYIESDSNTYLDLYIKDIDSKQYDQYITSVIRKGFNVDYRRSDGYFSGKDKTGNSVYINLDTGNIMHISLYAPES